MKDVNRCLFCNISTFTWDYAGISACFNCWKEYKVKGENINYEEL